MINKCKQCEYTYDSAKIDRAENMRNHKENRQKCDFKCSLCNFSSSHKRSLQVNHKIHTGEETIYLRTMQLCIQPKGKSEVTHENTR